MTQPSKSEYAASMQQFVLIKIFKTLRDWNNFKTEPEEIPEISHRIIFYPNEENPNYRLPSQC